MNDEVYWILELAVVEGRDDDFRALMREMVDATRANEPGALFYEWSTSADGRTCHIYERYADSDAVATHLKTFREKYATRFLGALKPTRFVVYGSLSPAAREATAKLGAVFMEPVAGFRR